MTDPEIASKTYIEPLTPDIVSQIILREKPDAILPTMGGQTALNLAVKLSESNFLKQNNIELIGADLRAINKAEDGIRDEEVSRGLGDVYKRQIQIQHQ